MRIAIHSLQFTLFEGEAEKVIVETPLGQMTVLDHHIPLISMITGPSIEVVKAGGEQKRVSISSGVIEVRPESEVIILANS